ncbi:hotdog family protein [Nocardia macrotermitis]|uniref:Thioesterase domain-containing protein n=1 Tax=Nocardia macrotermitis TaxID=2585198 RepID=A0A7K0DEX9_9NOCA|nr:hypothetical protein [Nocardia macrotermitis]MQY24228.1 hypothetical protein [Nocardia macrotermitis]
MSDDSATPPARFGAAPLEETRQAAAALRRLTGLLLSQEHSHPVVQEMLARLPEWERALTAAGPPDPTPRIGTNATPDQRIYLDHAFDVGDYNPCFPEYRFEHIDPHHAYGRVHFPLAYEGPPGLVHGGFLALFFDCVVQQQNCATDRAGKTRTLTLTYRRPTPLLTDLRFDVKRTVGQRDIESTARLLLDDVVHCSATVSAVAATPTALPGAQHAARNGNAT